MSIYRDTYVSIDGEYDKINAAYAYGGPEQAINTINRNLDLNITDFATVNFKALADAVDIVGGIKLTIKSEKELENLNDYIGNMNKINGGDSPKFEKTGTYTFDGNQAVAYSRIRYMEGGDHERANHQRLVVEGIVKKVKQQPWKLKALADTVIPQCKTSLSTAHQEGAPPLRPRVTFPSRGKSPKARQGLRPLESPGVSAKLWEPDAVRFEGWNASPIKLEAITIPYRPFRARCAALRLAPGYLLLQK